MLGSLGGVEGARVADLFAGTGALGIEALSRGASHVTFVEQDGNALEALRANVGTTGMGDRCDIVPAEVLAWLGRGVSRAHRGARRKEAGSYGYEIALCDPPYGFTAWDDLLTYLSAELAVLESSRGVQAAPGWDVLKVKRYGGTVVTLMRRLPHSSGGRRRRGPPWA